MLMSKISFLVANLYIYFQCPKVLSNLITVIFYWNLLKWKISTTWSSKVPGQGISYEILIRLNIQKYKHIKIWNTIE